MLPFFFLSLQILKDVLILKLFSYDYYQSHTDLLSPVINLLLSGSLFLGPADWNLIPALTDLPEIGI